MAHDSARKGLGRLQSITIPQGSRCNCWGMAYLLLCACLLHVQQCGSKPAAAVTAWCQENSPETSPLGLILELDILCPSGILRALTMPPFSKAELKTLQTWRLL